MEELPDKQGKGRDFCPYCGTWMFFKKVITTHRYYGYMDGRNGDYKEMLFECDTCKKRFFKTLPKGW